MSMCTYINNMLIEKYYFKNYLEIKKKPINP